MLAPAHRVGPGLEGHAVRDAVEPAAQRFLPGDRPGLAGEDEEGRLEGVLGVVRVAQHPLADAEHRGPVAPHQGRKRGRVCLAEEARQEIAVREFPSELRTDQSAQVRQDDLLLAVQHEVPSLCQDRSTQVSSRETPGAFNFPRL
jgi:hypothetical protein